MSADIVPPAKGEDYLGILRRQHHQRPAFYKLKKQGLAPCVTEAGTRRFITPESEAAWRKAMTRPAEQAAA